ncbi:disintegrin and metalloproteinase domain-containing protein 29-like [Emydura macquarii macquarii]|uniref:disintegrin and metalloproteinase domain-containing protein 29-like n=1 Tax=Emydura macquarii macquarii TaxID=1129001 RepID=UPI00352AB8EB
MPGSAGFKSCSICSKQFAVSDPPDRCLRCLGEQHRKEKCKICKSFKPHPPRGKGSQAEGLTHGVGALSGFRTITVTGTERMLGAERTASTDSGTEAFGAEESEAVRHRLHGLLPATTEAGRSSGDTPATCRGGSSGTDVSSQGASPDSWKWGSALARAVDAGGVHHGKGSLSFANASVPPSAEGRGTSVSGQTRTGAAGTGGCGTIGTGIPTGTDVCGSAISICIIDGTALCGAGASGTADFGTADFGTADFGTADFGTADFGTGHHSTDYNAIAQYGTKSYHGADKCPGTNFGTADNTCTDNWRIMCTEFSNCSRADYFNMIRKPGKTCLLNIPEKKIFGTQMCGNGVIEDEEECDCGMDEVCLRSGCCLSNCTIKPGAACISGLCCKKCQFHRQGKICRESIGECDLPEYCNGTSNWCPEDVFKEDGTPCRDNNCCFQGRCRSHERQCKAIFGKGAHLAPMSCFEALNTKGDRCGNCGGDGLTYKKCQQKDVLCGRLQCVNVKKIPRTKNIGSIVQTPVDNILCWGTEFHTGKDMVDVGSVGDGTACGDNKICINRTCVNITILNYDCNYTKCSDRGVCNSKKNCHCNYGWAPPDCKYKGFGGSVDSGPPPTSKMSSSDIIIMGIAIGSILLLLLVISFAIYKRTQIAQLFRRPSRKRQTTQGGSGAADTKSVKKKSSIRSKN